MKITIDFLKKNTIYCSLLLLSFILILFCLKSCTKKYENLWEPLEEIKNAEATEFKVHNIHRSQAGALFVVGYFRDAQYDCGMLGVLDCSLYKIYRSLDDGKNWEDVSDQHISEKHAFTKGDKIDSEYFRVPKLVQKIIDGTKYVLYLDQWDISFISSDQNNIYLFIDKYIYVSTDNGLTWKDRSSKKEPVTPIVSLDDPYGLFDSHIVLRGRINDISMVYKKGKDNLYEKINLYYDKEWENFTIFHKSSGAVELVPPTQKLSSNYYMEYGKLSKMDNGGEVHRVHEIFETANGNYFSSIVQKEVRATGLKYWVLWRSIDHGATFTKVPLYKNDEDSLYDYVKIYGCVGNKLILRVSERSDKTLTPGEGNMRYEKYYVYDVESGHLSNIVFPQYSRFSLDEYFNFTFDKESETMYLSTTKGIFKTKKGYWEKLKKDKTKHLVNPSTFDSKEVVAYDLLELFVAGTKCVEKSCFDKIFPSRHFEMTNQEREPWQNLALKMKSKPGIWVSNVDARSMIFQARIVNGNVEMELIIEERKGGNQILSYLEKTGFKVIENRLINQKEQFIAQKGKNSQMILLEKDLEKEDNPIFHFIIGTDKNFTDRNERFTYLIEKGKQGKSGAQELEYGFRFGMTQKEYNDRLNKLIQEGTVFQSQGQFFIERKFSEARIKMFSAGIKSLVSLNPEFTNDQLFRLAFFCYPYQGQDNKKKYNESLYYEMRNEYNNAKYSKGYETFLLNNVSHFIKDNFLIRISRRAGINILEFIDLSAINFNIDYIKGVDMTKKQ